MSFSPKITLSRICNSIKRHLAVAAIFLNLVGRTTFRINVHSFRRRLLKNRGNMFGYPGALQRSHGETRPEPSCLHLFTCAENAS